LNNVAIRLVSQSANADSTVCINCQFAASPSAIFAMNHLNSRTSPQVLQAIIAICSWLLSCTAFAQDAATASDAAESPAPLVWHDSYEAARSKAIEKHTCLWLVFHDAEPAQIDSWKNQIDRDLPLQAFLQKQSCALISIHSENQAKEDSVADGSQRLVNHPAFVELRQRAGLVVVDFREPDSPNFRQVISVVPNGWCDASRDNHPPLLPKLTDLREVTRLPLCSLTVRTLLLAVRTHPDSPQSTDGEFHPVLHSEAVKHAKLQADLGVQGHHDWGVRFQRINEQLPTDVIAQEVCAESWSGQGLLAAARECVHSWHQSPGHWNAVSARHPFFGYDMQRGANGTWYATGIFGKRR